MSRSTSFRWSVSLLASALQVAFCTDGYGQLTAPKPSNNGGFTLEYVSTTETFVNADHKAWLIKIKKEQYDGMVAEGRITGERRDEILKTFENEQPQTLSGDAKLSSDGTRVLVAATLDGVRSIWILNKNLHRVALQGGTGVTIDADRDLYFETRGRIPVLPFSMAGIMFTRGPSKAVDPSTQATQLPSVFRSLGKPGASYFAGEVRMTLEKGSKVVSEAKLKDDSGRVWEAWAYGDYRKIGSQLIPSKIVFERFVQVVGTDPSSPRFLVQRSTFVLTKALNQAVQPKLFVLDNQLMDTETVVTDRTRAPAWTYMLQRSKDGPAYRLPMAQKPRSRAKTAQKPAYLPMAAFLIVAASVGGLLIHIAGRKKV
jgi:hypothetical protein